jgi:hypothetical protein
VEDILEAFTCQTKTSLGYWVEILHDVEEHVEGQGMERERGRGGRLVDILRSREGN